MSSQRWMQVTVAVWLFGLIVVMVRVVVQPHRGSVYPIFAQAGQDWTDGVGLYGKTNRGLDQFRYSPLVAAGFVPFSMLPDRLANVLWRALNAGVLLAALAWWLRTSGPRSDAASCGVFLLVFPYALGNLNNGQSNALVIGLLLAAIAATADGRWNVAAGALALATGLKVYPLAVGLLLVVLYPRRLGPRLALAIAVGLVLPFLLQRPEYVGQQYADWLHTVGGDTRQDRPLMATYRDFRLLCRLWWQPLSTQVYLLLQLGIAATIAGISWRKRAAHHEPAAEREALLLLLAFASCWMTVFGPATESSTYLLLVPALALVIVQTFVNHLPAWERSLVVACYALLLAAQLSSWFPFGARFHTYGPQPTAGLVFLGYLLIRSARARVNENSKATVTAAALTSQAA